MSETSKQYAFYNLERTIAEFPVARILENMVQLELLPDTLPTPTEKLSTEPQRELLMAGLRNRTPKEIRPLLDLTKRQAPQHIAPWAKLLMARHVEIGRTVAIHSVTTPQPLVHAFAVGLRATLPPQTAVEAFGKPAVMHNGRITGQLADVQRTKTFEALQREGHTIVFAADSFGTNMAAVKKADNVLLVNFQSERTEPGYDHLYWTGHKPNVVHVQRAYGTSAVKYNLGNPPDEIELLKWLTRNDPAAQL